MTDCYKIQYRSKKHAENKMKAIKKRGYILSPNFYAYQCPNCGKFHLGHDKYYKERV